MRELVRKHQGSRLLQLPFSVINSRSTVLYQEESSEISPPRISSDKLVIITVPSISTLELKPRLLRPNKPQKQEKRRVVLLKNESFLPYCSLVSVKKYLYLFVLSVDLPPILNIIMISL